MYFVGFLFILLLIFGLYMKFHNAHDVTKYYINRHTKNMTVWFNFLFYGKARQIFISIDNNFVALEVTGSNCILWCKCALSSFVCILWPNCTILKHETFFTVMPVYFSRRIFTCRCVQLFFHSCKEPFQQAFSIISSILSLVAFPTTLQTQSGKGQILAGFLNDLWLKFFVHPLVLPLFPEAVAQSTPWTWCHICWALLFLKGSSDGLAVSVGLQSFAVTPWVGVKLVSNECYLAFEYCFALLRRS